MRKYTEYLSVGLLCAAAVVLIGLQFHFWGWAIYLLGILSLFATKRNFARDLLLVYLAVGILGFTKITTDVSYMHMIDMGVKLGLAVALPYLVSRFVYKDYLVRFKFHHGRGWYKTEILYIFLTAAVAYLLLPFYLQNTQAYRNWSVELNPNFITRLFIGTNGLGIWDELFFISTVFGILRRYFKFVLANLIQAILFTSFLFELGFTGWGSVMIFAFALIQGIVFAKTESLFYVITIHLTLDLILFLAIIHAYYPSVMPIFILR